MSTIPGNRGRRGLGVRGKPAYNINQLLSSRSRRNDSGIRATGGPIARFHGAFRQMQLVRQRVIREDFFRIRGIRMKPSGLLRLSRLPRNLRMSIPVG